jgi:hypothetical protein
MRSAGADFDNALGFAYVHRGEVYSSLSRIAREITATRWSGPLFFGVKK